jgi:hypothetical protein
MVSLNLVNNKSKYKNVLKQINFSKLLIYRNQLIKSYFFTTFQTTIPTNMQTFDESNLDRVYKAPKLTTQSLEYGRKDMPFLAFGGTEKPRTVVREYQKGSRTENYSVENRYGPLGKGAFRAKYGNMWDGEPAVYDSKNLQEGGKDNQMMHMTKKPRSESQNGGQIGPVITKQGRQMCTPGYKMQNGVCIMALETAVCQPGWYKSDGVCVKAPREFMTGSPGYEKGAMGAAPSSNEYPQTADEVLSMKRLRSYMQEKKLGSVHNENMTGGQTGAVVTLAFIFVIFLMVGLYFYNSMGQGSRSRRRRSQTVNDKDGIFN